MTSLNTTLTTAQRFSQAALEAQRQRTGHAPGAVTAVLGNDALVMTLHAAPTPAEQELARSAQGAAQVQDFHRRRHPMSSPVGRSSRSSSWPACSVWQASGASAADGS